MNRVVSVQTMQAWDRDCIQRRGIPEKTLMLTAAQGVTEVVLERLSANESVTCLCGSGNNGGDGFAVAWLLKQANRPVRIVFVGKEERLSEAARFYLEAARAAHVPITTVWEETENELLVDALFGVGLTRPVTGEYETLIARMNASKKPIVSVDIPSGIHADTGRVMGIGVQADQTVLMQYHKRGHLLGEGRRYSGKCTVAKLSEDGDFPFAEEERIVTEREVSALLPPRPFDSHKGKNGHSLLVVGSDCYHGAAVLSAKACLRAGTGLLTVLTVDAVRNALDAVPEAITASVGKSWSDTDETALLHLSKKTAVGIGCGIGEAELGRLLTAALDMKVPLVLDADALNYLAEHRTMWNRLHENVILTPHPGEMARLLGKSVEDVLLHPVEATSAFPCTVLLKGATTVIRQGNRIGYSLFGNAGLAKGGSGDVLTGILVALLSQGLAPFDAAIAGAYLLGTKADEALLLLGNRMLLATDLLDVLR